MDADTKALIEEQLRKIQSENYDRLDKTKSQFENKVDTALKKNKLQSSIIFTIVTLLVALGAYGTISLHLTNTINDKMAEHGLNELVEEANRLTQSIQASSAQVEAYKEEAERNAATIESKNNDLFGGIHIYDYDRVVKIGKFSHQGQYDLKDIVPPEARGVILKVIVTGENAAGSFVVSDSEGNFREEAGGHYTAHSFTSYLDNYVGGTLFAPINEDKILSWRTSTNKDKTDAKIHAIVTVIGHYQ